MSPARLLLPLVLTSVLLCGCTITFGPFDGDTAGEGEHLPAPDIWREDPPTLTEEQQVRQAEVDAYLVNQYRDYTIVTTTQGYSGDIIDWVDSSLLSIPYELPALPWTAADLEPPPGVSLALTELDLFPELRGPEGTAPLHRPDFSAYVMGESGAVSLQDYLENGQVFGMPAGDHRLYAGLHSPQQNNGISGTVNVFNSDVEKGTFSLVELTVACPLFGQVQEQIGIIISVDRVNSVVDAQPRLHVEYLRQVNGQLKGTWDQKESGFVLFPLREHSPGEVVPVSVLGGTQVEHRLDIFQVPTGDWWIGYNGHPLGYYPANLFTALNGGACRSAWYSEVYDGTPTDWTTTDMGSGQFAAAGLNFSAYVREPKYRFPYWVDFEPVEDAYSNAKPYVPPCYTRSTVIKSDLLGSHFFYGGPGGDAPGCD